MDKVIYEVNTEGIQQINYDDFHIKKLKESSVYLYDIKISQREEAVGELRILGLENRILKYILEPSEHIRFKYIGDSVYGEFSHFSSESDEPLKYIGVVLINNILVFVYDEDEDILIDFFDSFSDFSDQNNSILNAPSLLYVFVSKVLASHAKLILSYYEEMEDFSKKYRDNEDIDPKEFLESKSTLSDFAMAIEKLHFTLSFPPAKGILNQESVYRLQFQELLKTTDALKESLRQTGQRLNALNDHYHLILQDEFQIRVFYRLGDNATDRYFLYSVFLQTWLV